MAPLRLTKIYHNIFYHSKVIVLMKEMVFDNFQKARSRLKHFLNIQKLSFVPRLLTVIFTFFQRLLF